MTVVAVEHCYQPLIWIETNLDGTRPGKVSVNWDDAFTYTWLADPDHPCGGTEEFDGTLAVVAAEDLMERRYRMMTRAIKLLCLFPNLRMPKLPKRASS